MVYHVVDIQPVPTLLFIFHSRAAPLLLQFEVLEGSQGPLKSVNLEESYFPLEHEASDFYVFFLQSRLESEDLLLQILVGDVICRNSDGTVKFLDGGPQCLILCLYFLKVFLQCLILCLYFLKVFLHLLVTSHKCIVLLLFLLAAPLHRLVVHLAVTAMSFCVTPKVVELRLPPFLATCRRRF